MNAFAAHVAELADKNRVAVMEALSYEDRFAAYSIPAVKTIVIAAVVDEEAYAIAMHELGHCIAPQGGSKEVIVAERAAWKWAEANMFWKSPTMEQVKARAMGDPNVRDEYHITYERQHVLETTVREELEQQAQWMPAPVPGGTEKMADFMARRKRR